MSATGITVRVGTLADLPATAELWERAHAAGGRLLAMEHRGAIVIAGIAKRMTVDQARLFIAEGDENLAGMLLGSPAREEHGQGPTFPDLVHVSWVAVHPASWGRGIATRLMETFMEYARESGFRRVQLWTHQTNARAQRLYERLGFVASGRELTDSLGNIIVHYEREL
ncbi:MAG: GNAT family N-acetyltransferase [Vulcanimicrobiaceae bacterium]